MTLQTVCVLVCVVLVVVQCQVVDFTKQLTPGDISCGHLRCAANSSQTIISISVYNTTEKGNSVKLASISVFAPEVSIDSSMIHVINATGNISKYDGVLNVRFLRDVDCLYGAFQCELDFVKINGQPDVIRENLAPATEENAILNTLTEILTQLEGLKQDNEVFKQDNEVLKQAIEGLKQDNEVLKKDNEALKQDNEVLKQDIEVLKKDNETSKQDNEVLKQAIEVLKKDNEASKQDNEVLKQAIEVLKQDNEAVKTSLGSVLAELSSIKDLLNSTHDNNQQPGSSCYRSMPHKSPREKFLLQGNLPALCDTETDGGGWVIIQRRVRGDEDFYRGWDDYKRGFGTPDTDFWIGNDIIHNLTSQGYNELRIDFVSNGTEYFAQYTNFTVADESAQYLMTIGGFSGNVYDSMSYHNNNKFSTFDRDNDMAGANCAVNYHGAWWYSWCYNANLNGAWGLNGGSGIFWFFASGDISFTEMKIRNI